MPTNEGVFVDEREKRKAAGQHGVAYPGGVAGQRQANPQRVGPAGEPLSPGGCREGEEDGRSRDHHRLPRSGRPREGWPAARGLCENRGAGSEPQEGRGSGSRAARGARVPPRHRHRLLRDEGRPGVYGPPTDAARQACAVGQSGNFYRDLLAGARARDAAWTEPHRGRRLDSWLAGWTVVRGAARRFRLLNLSVVPRTIRPLLSVGE